MRTATHHTKRAKGHGHIASKLLRPVKKVNKKLLSANKRLLNYVAKKPVKSAGVASLLAAFVLGAVYAKMKFKIF